MTAPQEDPEFTLNEAFALSVIAGLGLLIGVIMIVSGVNTGNGSFLDGQSLEDLSAKITLISIGSSVASAGFLALLAALVLSGVHRVMVHVNRPPARAQATQRPVPPAPTAP